ncbi:MAG: mechanosensitive ion channel family protein [Steroidobacteraceae bacterium]
MEELRELAESVYFGNTLGNWAIALASFAVWLTVLPLARALIGRRLGRQTEARPIAALLLARSLVDRTTRLFMLAVAVYLAMRWLVVPAVLERGLHIAILIVFWFQVALWGTAAVYRGIEARRGHGIAAVEGEASLNILRFVGLVAVWSVALLMLLANLGVEIMPLVAGLGIGGVAVALAVQNVLGDLLASLAIALDKPFKVGDFLNLGQELGTVERIGIKSTHLRSLSGELIVLSNGDLLKSRVRNYGRMFERRVVFSVGIVYETPRARIGEVPGILEQAIRAQDKTRFDRAHFKEFGDFALIYEAVYYVLEADYNVYMNIQQAINLRIVDEFASRGIEFAYPTSKQWNVNLPAPAEAARDHPVG